jgi:predicted amidophosphoribosyltransferase
MARRKFTPKKVVHHAVSIFSVVHCPSCGKEVEMKDTECGGPEEHVGTCCGHCFRTEVVRVRLITTRQRPTDEVRKFIEDYAWHGYDLAEEFPDLFEGEE